MRSFLVFVILLQFACVETQVDRLTVETNATPASTPTPTLRPDGGYQPIPGPRDFREVKNLIIYTGSAVGKGSACAPKPCTPPPVEGGPDWIPQEPTGWLVTQKHLYKLKLIIDQPDVAFTTDEYEGVSYKFNGTFNSDGYFEETRPVGAVLIGDLTRTKTKPEAYQLSNLEMASGSIAFEWFSGSEIDMTTLHRTKPKN